MPIIPKDEFKSIEEVVNKYVKEIEGRKCDFQTEIFEKVRKIKQRIYKSTDIFPCEEAVNGVAISKTIDDNWRYQMAWICQKLGEIGTIRKEVSCSRFYFMQSISEYQKLPIEQCYLLFDEIKVITRDCIILQGIASDKEHQKIECTDDWKLMSDLFLCVMKTTKMFPDEYLKTKPSNTKK